MSARAKSLEKPYRYKHWLIWPNTVLSLMDISDCDDTINGVCLKDKTIEECIDECVGDCGAGIHAKFRDGRTICVPMRTALHPSLNPVFRMKKLDDQAIGCGQILLQFRHCVDGALYEKARHVIRVHISKRHGWQLSY